MKSIRLGKQFQIVFENCDQNILLKNQQRFINSINKILQSCGLIVERKVFYQFHPYGLTFIAVLSQSHIALHTWPEFNVIVVDLFVCQDNFDIRQLVIELGNISGAKKINKSTKIVRARSSL